MSGSKKKNKIPWYLLEYLDLNLEPIFFSCNLHLNTCRSFSFFLYYFDFSFIYLHYWCVLNWLGCSFKYFSVTYFLKKYILNISRFVRDSRLLLFSPPPLSLLESISQLTSGWGRRYVVDGWQVYGRPESGKSTIVIALTTEFKRL